MAKVGAEITATFRIGDPSLNQFFKIRLDLSDIETDTDLKEQLTASDKALSVVFEYLKRKIDTEIEKVLDNDD